MEIKIVSFPELSNKDVYDILRLRSEVFVVEQNCIYQDIDGMDDQAIHVLGRQGHQTVAYARILKPGAHYQEPAIGRVVTTSNIRKTGKGKAVFKAAIEYCRQHFPAQNIRIMAQCYLTKFYAEFGFEVDSDEFLEDGIPHVEMVLTSTFK